MSKGPIYCGADIDGPKIARHVVAWRKSCRIRVKERGMRCRFHAARSYDEITLTSPSALSPEERALLMTVSAYPWLP